MIGAHPVRATGTPSPPGGESIVGAYAGWKPGSAGAGRPATSRPPAVRRASLLWGSQLAALAALYAPALLLLLGLLAISLRSGTPLASFTRDPTALLQASPFLGLLSNLGVLLWCACAAVCCFTAALLRGAPRSRSPAPLLLCSGLFTAALLADDLFRIHDWFFPTVAHLRQEAIYAGYLAMALLFLARFRAAIRRAHAGLLLALSLTAFGLSVGADVLPPAAAPWHYLFEDGLKFLGIVGWFGYWLTNSYRFLRTALAG